MRRGAFAPVRCAPGTIDTPMLADMLERQAHTMKRSCGITRLDNWGGRICSPGASFVLRVALPVDGGSPRTEPSRAVNRSRNVLKVHARAPTCRRPDINGDCTMCEEHFNARSPPRYLTLSIPQDDHAFGQVTASMRLTSSWTMCKRILGRCRSASNGRRTLRERAANSATRD